MAHQFRSGQVVRLCRSIRYGAAEGDYEIVRQLPDEDGEFQYRIKSMREPHERVVKESDLEITARPAEYLAKYTGVFSR
jgi:hypothetical protein